MDIQTLVNPVCFRAHHLEAIRQSHYDFKEAVGQLEPFASCEGPKRQVYPLGKIARPRIPAVRLREGGWKRLGAALCLEVSHLPSPWKCLQCTLDNLWCTTVVWQAEEKQSTSSVKASHRSPHMTMDRGVVAADSRNGSRRILLN